MAAAGRPETSKSAAELPPFPVVPPCAGWPVPPVSKVQAHSKAIESNNSGSVRPIIFANFLRLLPCLPGNFRPRYHSNWPKGAPGPRHERRSWPPRMVGKVVSKVPDWSM